MADPTPAEDVYRKAEREAAKIRAGRAGMTAAVPVAELRDAGVRAAVNIGFTAGLDAATTDPSVIGDLLRTADQHRLLLHPGYEYATTTGPRKRWDDADVPPEGDGWVRNIYAGCPGEGWERFEYHEESYWMRRIEEGAR